MNVIPANHNHASAELQPFGQCPACDMHHTKYATKPLQPGTVDDHADQPPGVDVHDRDKQFPPVSEAAARVLEFVAWFGDGRVLPGGPLPDGPALFARDLEAVAKVVGEPPATVLAFINQRPEYVAAARNTPGDQDQTDYYRWQGHMEARRQLAQALGYTVPYEHGDKTTKKEES